MCRSTRAGDRLDIFMKSRKAFVFSQNHPPVQKVAWNSDSMVDCNLQPVMIPRSYDSVSASKVKPCPQVHGAAGLHSHRVQVVPVMKNRSIIIFLAKTGVGSHGATASWITCSLFFKTVTKPFYWNSMLNLNEVDHLMNQLAERISPLKVFEAPSGNSILQPPWLMARFKRKQQKCNCLNLVQTCTRSAIIQYSTRLRQGSLKLKGRWLILASWTIS